ncbi:MAG TPA: nitroreductase [Rubrivivax sp.]|nr:nitroreductase [Rubrivivax sp.]
MTVYEALASRRAVRDFLPTPVSGDVVRRVLEAAARAPSGGNVQPWYIDVVGGSKLDELKAIMQRRLQQVAAGDHSEPPEYDIYPKELWAPHRDYRFQLGEAMYAALGIPREDKARRLQWFARNYQFFGAPLALFCSLDRGMGPPQWSDLGMYLQSVMLLLREEGLDSCPQECWSTFPRTVGDFIGLPSGRMLFCGMAIGHANTEHPVNRFETQRAGLAQFARFHGV